jgi:lycopene cyclase domain-containing protein
VSVPEYTVGGVELAGLRSGIFRWRPYWLGLAICLFFMVLVNGWLTKLSAPIVIYAGDMKTPWRFPWDIPVEDYLFGFALLTAVAARWRAGADRVDPADPRSDPLSVAGDP